ncbi:MAG: Fis family transcriptional regulator [Gemmatimonadota bacterium]|nr:Fis family transcriptional regulator [Gemmatimonadota bacterium]
MGHGAPVIVAPFMHPDLFTDSWVQAWARELNASESYHHAARHWTWPVLLVLRADRTGGIDEDRTVYLDLFHGECREARMGTVADRERVKYVIAGNLETWQRVLRRELDPVLALLRRKLDLEKGGLFALTRHVRAAKELVNAAIRATASSAPPSGAANEDLLRD